MENVVIIGAGRAGTSIGKNLQESKKFRVTAIVDIEASLSAKSAEFIGNVQYTGTELIRASRLGNIIIIATPDDYIEATYNKLTNSADIQHKYIFHLSGSRPSTILNSAKARKCFTGSIHPLQSMPSYEEGYKNLKNAFFCIEGNSEAVKMAKEIVSVISGKFFTIDTEMKPLYHAAAVFASNFINTTVFASFSILKNIGVPENSIAEIILPLIKGTVNNIEKLGVINSLTGPVTRGDYNTIEAHIDGLKKTNSEFSNLYKTLTETTIKLASLNQKTPDLSKIEKLLKKEK